LVEIKEDNEGERIKSFDDIESRARNDITIIEGQASSCKEESFVLRGEERAKRLQGKGKEGKKKPLRNASEIKLCSRETHSNKRVFKAFFASQNKNQGANAVSNFQQNTTTQSREKKKR